MLARSSTRPITLIVPCHSEDVGRRPLQRILEELNPANWLSEILVPVNGFKAHDDFLAARRDFDVTCRWLWTDGPAAEKFHGELLKAGLASKPRATGKGWNAWLAMGLALGRSNEGIIAVHDADISNYRREMLVRLCAPLLHP